jgi:hypothetical protein
METYTFTILSANTETNSVLIKYTPDNIILSEITQNISAETEDFLQSIDYCSPQTSWENELNALNGEPHVVEIGNYIGRSGTMTLDKILEAQSVYKSNSLDSQNMEDIKNQFLDELSQF